MTDIDATLGDVVTLLEQATDMDEDNTTLEDLGRRLQLVLHIAGQAREIRDLIEVTLIDKMEEDTLSMGDVTVVKEKATRSSWKPSGSARMREDIAHNVAAKLALDIGTGEVDVGRRNIVEHAIKELWTIVPAFSNMKVDGRERYDLKISEYRDYSDGWNVRVIVNEEGAEGA